MRRSQRRGAQAEQYFFDRIKEVLPDLKMTCNSGAKFGDGDMLSEQLLIDVKSSEGKDFPKITADEWGKVRRQAYSLGKDFIIPIITADKLSGIIFPEDLAIEALKALYQSKMISKVDNNGCDQSNKEAG